MIKQRAVIYARVSTERQKEKQTIDSQLSILPNLIEQRGYVHILEPYVDDGISGETIEERPAMTRLLDDAERGLFDAVFVVDLDRLTRARKSIDWELIKDSFRKGKVKVVTPGTEYNFEDEDQEFMSDMFSRIAAYEKKKILRRMTRGKAEKARQGKFFGGKVLYGYTYDPDSKEYKICEAEAKVVRTIFEMCNQGMSVRRIVEHLNNMGIPTPSISRGQASGNKAWGTSTVSRILKESAYTGEFERWKYQRVDRKVLALRPKEERVSAQIPAIIENETFKAAGEALRGRKVLSKRRSKREYLLSGIIHCESCGCKMVGECSKGANELLYYVCSNARNKSNPEKECPIRSVRVDRVEPVVWNMTVSLLRKPKALRRAIVKALGRASRPDKVDDLTRSLKSKEEEESRLLDLYQYGNIDRSKLSERLEKLSSEKAYIQERLGELNKQSKVNDRLSMLNDVALILEKDIKSLSFEEKREIMRALFFKDGAGIYVNGDNSIEMRGYIDFSKMDKGLTLNNLVSLSISSGRYGLRSRRLRGRALRAPAP